MNGWALFFILIGVARLTYGLFQVIDLIEKPRRRRSRQKRHSTSHRSQQAYERTDSREVRM